MTMTETTPASDLAAHREAIAATWETYEAADLEARQTMRSLNDARARRGHNSDISRLRRELAGVEARIAEGKIVSFDPGEQAKHVKHLERERDRLRRVTGHHELDEVEQLEAKAAAAAGRHRQAREALVAALVEHRPAVMSIARERAAQMQQELEAALHLLVEGLEAFDALSGEAVLAGVPAAEVDGMPRWQPPLPRVPREAIEEIRNFVVVEMGGQQHAELEEPQGGHLQGDEPQHPER